MSLVNDYLAVCNAGYAFGDHALAFTANSGNGILLLPFGIGNPSLTSRFVARV